MFLYKNKKKHNSLLSAYNTFLFNILLYQRILNKYISITISHIYERKLFFSIKNKQWVINYNSTR